MEMLSFFVCVNAFYKTKKSLKILFDIYIIYYADYYLAILQTLFNILITMGYT